MSSFPASQVFDDGSSNYSSAATAELSRMGFAILMTDSDQAAVEASMAESAATYGDLMIEAGTIAGVPAYRLRGRQR